MQTLLTRPEAARRARVCLRTLDGILARPNGPRVARLGRRVLIDAASFNDWIGAQLR